MVSEALRRRRWSLRGGGRGVGTSAARSDKDRQLSSAALGKWQAIGSVTDFRRLRRLAHNVGIELK